MQIYGTLSKNQESMPKTDLFRPNKLCMCFLEGIKLSFVNPEQDSYIFTRFIAN